MQLMSRDAVLAGAHQVDRQQPLGERDLGILEDRSDQDGELLAARTTLPETAGAGRALLGRARSSLRFDEIGMIDNTAVRANGAVRPADTLDQLVGCPLVGEVLCQRAQVDRLGHDPHHRSRLASCYQGAMGASSI